MKWLVASVATIALASGAGLAQPGNGNGNGNGNKNKGNGGQSAMVQSDRGNGNAKAMRGNDKGNGNGNRGGGNAGAMVDRGNGNSGGPAIRAQSNGNGNGNAKRDNAPRIERANGNRGNGNSDRGNGNVVRDVIRDDRSVVYYGPDRYRDRNFSDNDRRGLIDGCPPGLAKKYNNCQPPGQAKKDGFLQRDSYGTNWWGLPDYRDSNYRYRYDSGYLLRMGSGGGIADWIPLLGGALGIGQQWPTNYGYTGLSPYYQNYYGLGDQRSYRYADNVVYRLDPQTSAITSIAALLTGDDFVVGQPAPMGYDIYNVPYSYRDRYYDTNTSNYRYSDGYIYEIDPTTRLVAAAIELLI